MFIFSNASGAAVVWKLELADDTNAKRVELSLQTYGQVERQGTRVVLAASDVPANMDWAFTP
jgi:hypothetical protein